MAHRIEPRFRPGRTGESGAPVPTQDQQRIAQLETELQQAREALKCAIVRGTVPAVLDYPEALQAAGIPNVREALSVAQTMLSRRKPSQH
jgi:hypothetical protein